MGQCGQVWANTDNWQRAIHEIGTSFYQFLEVRSDRSKFRILPIQLDKLSTWGNAAKSGLIQITGSEQFTKSGRRSISSWKYDQIGVSSGYCRFSSTNCRHGAMRPSLG